MSKKDIENKNSKGQLHGYNEWYYKNKLYFRCNYKNGLSIGYQELHYLKQTIFCII